MMPPVGAGPKLQYEGGGSFAADPMSSGYEEAPSGIPLDPYNADPYAFGRRTVVIPSGPWYRILATISQLLEDMDLAACWYFTAHILQTRGNNDSIFAASVAFSSFASLMYVFKFLTPLFMRRVDIVPGVVPILAPFFLLHADVERVDDVRRIRSWYSIILKVFQSIPMVFITGIFLFRDGGDRYNGAGLACFIIGIVSFFVSVNEALHVILNARENVTPAGTAGPYV
eukprot:tig00021036_g17272.t1